MMPGISTGIWLWWLMFLPTGTAVPQFDHRTAFGLTPPSEPELDEISGPFEIKVVARIDTIHRRWQRLFDFGTQFNSDEHHSISLAIVWSQPTLRFNVHDGVDKRSLEVPNVVDEGEVTVWTVGVNAALHMYVKKNGVEVGSTSDGILPANVTRPIKYIGRSVWADDDDLLGAVLGMQFVTGGTSYSNLPMEWMNYPGQLNGAGFSVSGYARFNDVGSGSWQRVFDFSDGNGTAVVNLGQWAGTNDMRLEVDNGGGSKMTLDADNSIIDQEMAFWEAGIADNGLAWIRKNGTVVASQTNFLIPSVVFRRDHRFGSSHNPLHDPLIGVVLGIRVDKEVNS